MRIKKLKNQRLRRELQINVEIFSIIIIPYRELSSGNSGK